MPRMYVACKHAILYAGIVTITDLSDTEVTNKSDIIIMNA
jgi:hypothetical protein